MISKEKGKMDQNDPFRSSSSFKSVSREKKAAWGHRFVRDHNDLYYEANPESISNRLKKQSYSKTPKGKIQDKQSLHNYQTASFKARKPVTSQSTRNLNNQFDESKGLKLQRYLKGVEDYETKFREGVTTATRSGKKWKEHAQQGWENDYGLNRDQGLDPPEKGSNLFGLSRYQYNETIKGKINSRSNHHIDFDKHKTNKIDNRNKIWYANNEEPPRLSPNSKNNKIHSFHSYSSHKLFGKTKKMSEDNGCGYGGLLDKFYDISSPEHYRATHENTLQTNVNYMTMTARPSLQKKLGTNLDYKTQKYKTLKLGDGKRPLMELSRSQRKLVFNRQVINPRRGCFR